MTTVVQPSYSWLPSEHLEELWRSLSVLTLDPYKKSLHYFFPFIGAFFSGHYPLRLDPSLAGMMPVAKTTKMLQDIEQIARSAGVEKVNVYTALTTQFSSCGGSFSFTTPALFIPYQYLFRPNNRPFPQEASAPGNGDKLWTFSDDEVRFLIAREVVQIKANSTLWQIAAKVTIVAAVFVLYASSFPLIGSLTLSLGAVITYIYSERTLQQRADIKAVEILSPLINNAKDIAIHTLEKIQAQNLDRRDHSKVAKFYITKAGNNVLDFIHPLLSTRIERLNRCVRSS